MKLTLWMTGAAAVCLTVAVFLPQAQADPIPRKYRPNIKKGLDWLARMESKGDIRRNRYPIAMTAMAGTAMLMDGSTMRSGPYAENIRSITEYLMKKSQPNGMIGDPRIPAEAQQYMYGHGFSTLFLASVYGDDDSKDRQAELKDVLTRAVKFIGNAQSTQGGWYYTSAKDNGDQDEGSVTITQVQALRACRNAGIEVPFEYIKKAQEYLRKSTTKNGGVIYRLGRGRVTPIGGERPALTAAAISCGFGFGDYKSDIVKRWFKYCESSNVKLSDPNRGIRFGHFEYTHYYYAQAVYILGDDGWEKLFQEKNGLTWKAYRAKMFAKLANEQGADGSWNGNNFGIGPVYTTSIYLTVLQLDGNALPIYQR